MEDDQRNSAALANSNSRSPEIELAELLRGSRRVFIRHDDRLYVLRITRQNRLILTRAEAEPDASPSASRERPQT